MNPKLFTSSAWVRLVRSTEGVTACVPRNLPPPLVFDALLVGALSAADRALGQLAGMLRSLPNPRLLLRGFIHREAVLSSRIEGTRTTVSDLFLFDVAPDVEQNVPDVREVVNYVRALDHGLERLRHVPLSLNLIRELHGILLEGVRGSDRRPGEFRNRQNYIGSSRHIDDAVYVPPPHTMLLDPLRAFERFVNRPSDLPLLVRLAMIHYQFEAIHPFEDGNGRVGRLLTALLLDSGRALPHPVLYLSAYFERNRAEYYDRLRGVSEQGHWSAWVDFFLRGVADQAVDVVERIDQLVDLRDRWVAQFQTARRSALALKLIDSLFQNPFVNVASVRRLLNVHAQSAQNSINQLMAGGVLAEITGRQRNRVYAARDVLRIIEQTPAFDSAR